MSGSGEFLTYFPKVMSAFEIPTVSLTSEENGRCLNTVHGKHTFTITTMETVFWRQYEHPRATAHLNEMGGDTFTEHDSAGGGDVDWTGADVVTHRVLFV